MADGSRRENEVRDRKRVGVVKRISDEAIDCPMAGWTDRQTARGAWYVG